jgi:ATP-dependent helicase/nuclease subunit B
VWTDLQLPLYAAACRSLYPGSASVGAAYFVLPNAVADTDILPWDKLDEATVSSARACAEEVFRRIRAGVFWPPRAQYTDRDWASRLFFDRVEKHLDPDFLQELADAAAAYGAPGSAAGGRTAP